MPDYRVTFDVAYRLPADSDADVYTKLRRALETLLTDASLNLLTSVVSPVQNQPGVTLWDVRLYATGTVTAASIGASTPGATLPPNLSLTAPTGTANRQAIETMASINTVFQPFSASHG